MKASEANHRSTLVGSRIGKFDVIAEIGTGGMASVYLARSTAAGGFNRLAAIKVMHPHLSQEDSFIEMFLDEARVAATIQHPNVISIVDVGIEEGLIFLVMDYVEGDSFSAIEKMAVNLKRRIPLGIILRVVLDSLAGLHHAHELCDHQGQPLRIVHRDVSPQNIMVGVDGIARIVDFGIAKAESRITTTQVGLIKGKINFMAPEQIRGGQIDRRVDIFGMGVTLWEAITLRRLYAGQNDFDTARRILSGEYPSLIEADPKLPPALDDICRRALHLDPDQRFRTAEEFAESIESYLRPNIAAPREVTAFISGVASQKLERERRAIRESSAQPDDGDGDGDEEGGYMSTTMVELPVSAPAVDAISAVLPSSSAPRDRSHNEGTVKQQRLRAPTMSMPSHLTDRGSARPVGAVPPGAAHDLGATTRSLRIQPQSEERTSAPPGGHEGYDDDGATSPFHASVVAGAAAAFRAIAPSKPAPPRPSPAKAPAPRQAPAYEEDEFDTADGARTLFQPVQAQPVQAQPVQAQPVRAQPTQAQRSGQREYSPPNDRAAIPSPAESTHAIDLIQRRGGQPEVPPSQMPTAPSQPYAMPPGVYPAQTPHHMMFPPIPRDPPGMSTPPEEGSKGVSALVYVLLSLLLVGGGAALLWYVLYGRAPG